MEIVKYNPNVHRSNKTCLASIIKVAKHLYKEGGARGTTAWIKALKDGANLVKKYQQDGNLICRRGRKKGAKDKKKRAKKGTKKLKNKSTRALK